MFEDHTGSTHILHGINAVYKQPPWIPIIDYYDSNDSFSMVDMLRIKSCGFNVVRLGVMWAGVMPLPPNGTYIDADGKLKDNYYINNTYLSEIERIVGMLGDLGIYSILDMHQDVLNRHFCG